MPTSEQLLEINAIRSEADVVAARRNVKQYALSLKFSLLEQTKLVTAASEIARNTLIYGGGGQLAIKALSKDDRRGLCLIFEDQGPGIADVSRALQDNYTTGKGLGLGLGGAKRLVSEFAIESRPGQGTRITLIKWKL